MFSSFFITSESANWRLVAVLLSSCTGGLVGQEFSLFSLFMFLLFVFEARCVMYLLSVMPDE